MNMNSIMLVWWSRTVDVGLAVYKDLDAHRIPNQPETCAWFTDSLDGREKFRCPATIRTGDAGRAVDVALRAGADRVEVRPCQNSPP